MTVAQTLSRAQERLSSTSESPRSDASILLAHVLSKRRAWLIAHDDEPVAVAGAERLRALCELRATGMPIAYLTTSAWFYGRRFEVGPDVLIPRPESEHLVDEAARFLRNSASSQPRVLEIGVGSGAIACTIAAEVPNASVDATDVSHATLALARKNAQALGVDARVALHAGDLAGQVAGSSYDLVVANLPYVPTRDLPQAPAPAAFEPAIALDGGADGLTLYRRLLPQLAHLVAPGGLALLEAAPPTIRQLAKMARRALPNARVEIRRDYAGLERYVHCENTWRPGPFRAAR